MTRTMFEISARDSDQLAALNAEVFTDDWGEQWSRRDLLSALSMPGVKARGVCVDYETCASRLAGFILSRCVLDEVEILLIGVDQVCRHQGLGSAMLGDFFQDAKEKAVSRIFLEVRENNLAARALYKSAGFNAIGRRKNYYRGKFGHLANAITLEKRLI